MKKDRPDKDSLIQIITRKMLKEHLTKVDIMDWLQDPEIWEKPYPKSSATSIMRECQEYITEIYRDTAAHTLDDMLTALNQDRQAALKRGDYRLAFDILKEIDKITGKYREVIDINHEVTFKTKWGGK